jgi:hypothetical protein
MCGIGPKNVDIRHFVIAIVHIKRTSSVYFGSSSSVFYLCLYGVNSLRMILRCIIPVVCRINQTVMCRHISSNTTMYWQYAKLLYVNHNYMFRPQNLAIIRLYK